MVHLLILPGCVTQFEFWKFYNGLTPLSLRGMSLNESPDQGIEKFLGTANSQITISNQVFGMV